MITIGSVGRLSAQKRPDRFVAVAKAVLSTIPDAKFIWIGDGELRAATEAQAVAELGPDKLIITGWLDEVRIQEFGIDIYLATADYEGFGYAVLEAMSAGIPCVVSDTTGHCDLVSTGFNGARVPMDDIAAYAKVIVQLHQDPALRARWATAGQRETAAKFTLEQMVDQTEQIYRQVRGTKR